MQISSSPPGKAELRRPALTCQQWTNHSADKLRGQSSWNHTEVMNFSVTASGMKNVFFFFLTQSNFLSWAPILPNVENQSYRFRGTWSSSQTSQSIQDSIAFTSRDQPPFRQTLGAVELCLSHRQFGSFHTALVTWAGVWGHASFSGSSSHPRDGALSTPTTSCPNFRIHSWCPRQLPGPLMCLPSGAEVGIQPHHRLSPCRRVIQWLLSGREGQSPPQAPTRSTLFTNTWVWIRVPSSFLLGT